MSQVVLLGESPQMASWFSKLVKKAKKKGKKAISKGELSVSKGGISYKEKTKMPAPGEYATPGGMMDFIKNPIAIAAIAGGGILVLSMVARKRT
jgi:hypothetical protein